MGRYATCPAGTDAGTRYGTGRGTDALRCWVQNQNQNQNQTVVTAVCGVSGYSIHPSSRPSRGAVTTQWMAADAAMGGGQ